MCSYDRAARWVLPRHRTLPKVCPNTYYLPELIAPVPGGYAPFSSMAPRRDDTQDKKDAALPSAADYNPRPTRPRVPGGTALWSMEPRLKEEVDEDGPGPGDYDIRSLREREEEMKRHPVVRVGKLYQCRVPYTVLGPSPPSIPHRNNVHGYQINQNGAIKANPGSFHDLSLGPAFYHTEKRPFATYNNYKGGQWSRSTSKRTFGVGKEGPGPGTYELDRSRTLNPSQARDELIRFYKRQESRQPRLAEIVEIKALREDVPGPGHYNVPYIPKEKEKKSKCGFLSSSERFRDTRDEVPSPCDYDVIGSYEQEKPGSVRMTGFMSDTARFQDDHSEDKPGPADYDIPSPRHRPPRHVSCVTAFNTCKERDLNTAPKHAALTPACNLYYPKEPGCSQEGCRCSAVFKSSVARMSSTEDNGLPNCATYTVGEADQRLREKRSFRHPCECVGTSFDVTQPRFGPIRDVKTAIKDLSLPGPAEYNMQRASHRKKRNLGGPWDKAPRFGSYGDPCLPGPASYQINRDTSTKATFNTTLKPPQAPKPHLWHSRPKKLLWFARQRPGQPPEMEIDLPDEED